MAHPDAKRRPPKAAAGGPRAARPGLLLWGTHPVLAALANPARSCHRLLATREAADSLAAKLTQLAGQRRLPPPEILARPALDQFLPPGAVPRAADAGAGTSAILAPIHPRR